MIDFDPPTLLQDPYSWHNGADVRRDLYRGRPESKLEMTDATIIDTLGQWDTSTNTFKIQKRGYDPAVLYISVSLTIEIPPPQQSNNPDAVSIRLVDVTRATQYQTLYYAVQPTPVQGITMAGDWSTAPGAKGRYERKWYTMICEGVVLAAIDSEIAIMLQYHADSGILYDSYYSLHQPIITTFRVIINDISPDVLP